MQSAFLNSEILFLVYIEADGKSAQRRMGKQKTNLLSGYEFQVNPFANLLLQKKKIVANFKIAAEAQRSAQRFPLSPEESLPCSCQKGRKKITLKGVIPKLANSVILQPLNTFLIDKSCPNNPSSINVDSVFLLLLLSL